MEQVGHSLVSQGDAFRRLQLVLLKNEPFYSYNSLLGTSVTMKLDWEKEEVTLTYLDSELILSMEDFRYMEIYEDWGKGLDIQKMRVED